MLEVVTVKVRPSYCDRKLHILRFLFDSSVCDFTSFRDAISLKLDMLFPKGHFNPVFDRKVIDYSFNNLGEFFSLVENCSHDFLSKYLYSSEN